MSSLPLPRLPLVHMNGAVNLPSTESVMRELATRIPDLAFIPDGETEPAERKLFMRFLQDKFHAAKGLEAIPALQMKVKPVEVDYQQVQLVAGVFPSDIQWPEVGYTAYYLQSWKVFQKLEREGVLAPLARFQVQLPTPLACVSAFVRRGDALAVLPSFQKAMFDDLDRLLQTVPPEKIAVQWDLPMEIGTLEAPELFAVSNTLKLDTIADLIARCINHVPHDIPVGMHLCYGDAGHKHWKEPTSLQTQVNVINALASRVRRPITYAAFTVPQYAANESYFAPLRELTPTLEMPYLGLIPYHPEEQKPGTTDQQIRLVRQYLGLNRRWGVCTECGLSGVTREEMPAILDLHASIARKVAAAM
ncbi:hypothetical protein EDB80DRAFT_870403 [Ilyonectria destructans]|nr:hypothetical protein EDB80DRAFT_870403 [Ilyonectria destructans]